MTDKTADFATLSAAAAFTPSSEGLTSEADIVVAAAFSRLLKECPIDDFLDRATEENATMMLKMFTLEAIIAFWNENSTFTEPEGPNFALAAQLFASMEKSTESVPAVIGGEKKEVSVQAKFYEALTVFLDVQNFHSSMLYAMGYCDPALKLSDKFVDVLIKYAATEDEQGFLESLRE